MNRTPIIKKTKKSVFIVSPYTLRLTTSLLFVIFSCQYKSPTQDQTTISFTDSIIDMGILKYNQPDTVCFTYQNEGDSPLVIYRAVASCGCTDPIWKKRPLKPGKQGTLNVIYNADSPGVFNKTISVYSNTKEKMHNLTIRGRVEE